MFKYILGAMVVFVLIVAQTGCTDEKESLRILEAQGYTNIQFTGYDWFACSEDDPYKTGFTATGVNGKSIVGTVCSGLFFKNSTIRFK